MFSKCSLCAEDRFEDGERQDRGTTDDDLQVKSDNLVVVIACVVTAGWSVECVSTNKASAGAVVAVIVLVGTAFGRDPDVLLCLVKLLAKGELSDPVIGCVC